LLEAARPCLTSEVSLGAGVVHELVCGFCRFEVFINFSSKGVVRGGGLLCRFG
jgi:hypothetical protein